MTESVIAGESAPNTYHLQAEEVSPFATHPELRSRCNPRGLPNPHHTKVMSRERAEKLGMSVCEECVEVGR